MLVFCFDAHNSLSMLFYLLFPLVSDTSAADVARIFSDALCYPLFYADAGSAVTPAKIINQAERCRRRPGWEKIENPQIYFSLPRREQRERIERCW